jgi:hypothetical protein
VVEWRKFRACGSLNPVRVLIGNQPTPFRSLTVNTLSLDSPVVLTSARLPGQSVPASDFFRSRALPGNHAASEKLISKNGFDLNGAVLDSSMEFIQGYFGSRGSADLVFQSPIF